MAERRDETVNIAIVGGGISGLYCALQLARLITVEKRRCIFGGDAG